MEGVIILNSYEHLTNPSSIFLYLVWGCDMFVDDAKANDKVINLVQDQFAHIGQIVWTWLLCL